MRVLEDFSPPRIAIDAGTAVTRICTTRSAVLERPSAIHEDVDGVRVGRPTMQRGVIADIAGESEVIATMLHQVWPRRDERPSAVVCAPSDATPQEREALLEAVTEAGANVVSIVNEPLAAAIGAGVDVAADRAGMVVDIGDGVTDIAVIRNASILSSAALRIGCGDFRRSIQQWLEWHHDLTIDDDALDALVRNYFMTGHVTATLALPAPHRVLLPRDDVGAVIEPVIESIAAFVSRTFDSLPEAVAAEISARGIHITGGGSRFDALVHEIDRRVPVLTLRASDPLNTVIRGARTMLRRERLLRHAR